MKISIRQALPASLSVALVAGALAVPAIATTADEDTTTDAAEETTADADADAGKRGTKRAPRGMQLEDGEMVSRLAAELGLDTETVQAAVDAVKSDLAAERLATAVEEGKLTQEQADRITQAIVDGNVEEVREAVQLEQLTAKLDEKVAAGDLTQEEADERIARAEAGEGPGDKRGPGKGGRGDHGGRGERGPRGGGEDAGTDATVQDTVDA